MKLQNSTYLSQTKAKSKKKTITMMMQYTSCAHKVQTV